VCGEPLYSKAYQQKVVSEVNTNSEPLCPQHQQRQAASRLPLLRPRKSMSKLGDK
jgi:hypothetical protein